MLEGVMKVEVVDMVGEDMAEVRVAIKKFQI